MVRCINKECQNHGYELEGDVKSCPACGTETVKYVEKTNGTLTIVSVLAAIVSAVIAFSVYGIFGMVVAIGVSIASIVVGFMSKSKIAILVSIVSLPFVLLMAAVMFELI